MRQRRRRGGQLDTTLYTAEPDGISGRVYMGNSNLGVNGFPVTFAFGYNRLVNNGNQYIFFGQTPSAVSGFNLSISNTQIMVSIGNGGGAGSASSYTLFTHNRTHTLDLFQHYIIEIVSASVFNLYINNGSAIAMVKEPSYTASTYNWTDARYYFFYRTGYELYSGGFKIYNPRFFYGSTLTSTERTKVYTNDGLVGFETFALNKKVGTNWVDDSPNSRNGAITETITFDELV
uniref:hypothetical protein n=1 Tax=Roseivirga sp. TaxID=1964215 RepID=UPI004047D8A7